MSADDAFLFHRRDYCPTTDTQPDWVAESVFFSQWTTKQSPWAEFEDGTRLWWVDQRTREVRWEVRARHVLKQPFSSRREAGELLRRSFGLMPTELSNYYGRAASSGWLLAFGIDVMQAVSGVALPRSEVLGRNGFRRISAQLASVLAAAGLPNPAPAPIATCPPWFNADAITSVFVPNRSRRIPESVRQAVHDQCQGRCVRCGSGPPSVELHVDHRYPWSKGGPNELWNLQLLCRDCNLAKGAKVEDGATLDTFEEPVAALARALECPPIRSVDDLPGLVARGIAEGHEQLAVDVVVAIDRDGVVADHVVLRCIDELAQSPNLADRVTMLRSSLNDESISALTSLLDSTDESVSQEAALHLARVTEDDGERINLLTHASRSGDARTSGLARIALAGSGTLGADHEEALRSELSASDAVVRSCAALELIELISDIEGRSESEEILHLWNVVLASPDDDQFALAAICLAELWAGIDDERARNYLSNVAALDDPGAKALAQELLDDFDRTGRVELNHRSDAFTESKAT